MKKKVRAASNFKKMGKLGKRILKLSSRNGLDIEKIVLLPDRSIEVYLQEIDSLPVIRGFQDEK